MSRVSAKGTLAQVSEYGLRQALADFCKGLESKHLGFVSCSFSVTTQLCPCSAKAAMDNNSECSCVAIKVYFFIYKNRWLLGLDFGCDMMTSGLTCSKLIFCYALKESLLILFSIIS